MRRTRIFTIVLFVIAAAAFAVSQVMQMMTDKSGPAISMDTDSITVENRVRLMNFQPMTYSPAANSCKG